MIEKNDVIAVKLARILATMDVPSLRIDDINWLSRNLAVRNASHPDFKTANKLIRQL